MINGSECGGDRTSQASSTDLSELTGMTLTSEAESCLTEDEEPDTPVKPSLRLDTGYNDDDDDDDDHNKSAQSNLARGPRRVAVAHVRPISPCGQWRAPNSPPKVPLPVD